MRWRVAIHWFFAMIFFVTAACASAHSEFELKDQPAPACSHEPSSQQPDDQQPVTHCTDCMQVHYLQESAPALDSIPLIISVAGSLPIPSQDISLPAVPVLDFPPHEPIAASPSILRI